MTTTSDAVETLEPLSMGELMNNQFTGNAEQYRFNHEEDKGLHVRFYMEAIEQTAASIRASRRIWSETEMIEIMIPGDKSNIVRHQVFDMDRQRFPVQYDRFKKGLADQAVGTRLSDLHWMNMSKVKEYEFFNITTVEQLVATADGSPCGQGMMGFHGDKQKAKGFLDSALATAPVAELRLQVDQSKEETKALKAQLADMNTRLERATANMPKHGKA